MSRALYAGTFDPFTLAHDDIVRRSLELFSPLVILLAVSPNKKPHFSLKERLAMVRNHFCGTTSVTVDSTTGLVVDYAKEKGIHTIVRGLRPTGDFEGEFQMASMNKRLNPEIETVFLATGIGNYFISSSLVKELWQHGRDISPFVPPSVLEKMGAKSP